MDAPTHSPRPERHDRFRDVWGIRSECEKVAWEIMVGHDWNAEGYLILFSFN